MDRSDYYGHYQANLQLLDCEMEQVKAAAQQAIGEKAWLEKKHRDQTQIATTANRVKACTRLYTFLLCSWFEARLLKMLYENSSVAFTDQEIATIRSNQPHYKEMNQKWKESFSIAVCRSYGFSYAPATDYTSSFANGSVEQRYYTTVCSFFSDIAEAITIRNRLGHGQWDIQFNGSNTNVANYAFFTEYDNIQKLNMLKQAFNEIAEIINCYVTNKDKHTSNFHAHIEKRINNVFQIKTRIQNSDFEKYARQLERLHARKVELSKQN
ncbi:MAG: hypothetical protein E7437_07735 [Ruminococcaceae bacterium]|nr:hypothetical protein [Oscillospiraceae bacterium]